MAERRRSILVINGHPDPRPERLCAALAGAYAVAATKAGHFVDRIDLGRQDFPLISSEADFLADAPPEIVRVQRKLQACDHLVIVHPLWLGSAPAELKGLLEQVFRYGVALSPPGKPMRGLLAGKTGRIVVTMGMPAPIFRMVFDAAGLKALSRGLLWICGVRPVATLVLGGVGAASAETRGRWVRKMEALGAAAR